MSREKDGRFSSGSPGGPGRPPGFSGVAKKIMLLTRDGDALIAFAWSVLNSPLASSNDRWKAHQWLSERGLGKPATSEEVLPVEDYNSPIDFSKLDDADLTTLEHLLVKSKATCVGDPNSEGLPMVCNSFQLEAGVNCEDEDL